MNFSTEPPATSTLFCAELPDDFQEFEQAIQNTPGYQGCRERRDRNGNRVAFVEFDSVVNAATAKGQWQGHQFPDGRCLVVNFSKSNTAPAAPGLFAGAAPMHAAAAYGLGGGVAPPPGVGQRAARVPNPDRAGGATSGGNSVHAHMDGDAAPSNQLVVHGGVPSDATPREMSHIFRPFAGFIELRMIRNQRGRLMCFVDFETTQNATEALQTLQSYKMDAQDRHGLRMSFAEPKN